MSSPLRSQDQNQGETQRKSAIDDSHSEKKKRLEMIKSRISGVKLKLQKRMAEALGVTLEEFLESKDALEELKDSLSVWIFIQKNVVNFGFKTLSGSLDANTQKINQDTYLIFPQFTGKQNCHFFGVCDGHGSHGHLVANFVKQTLPSLLFI